jgi:LysR family glycine cleavage system transcriptional activator
MNSLRAFEAVSRLGSITKASTELCVSQGAVSQQIRNLEDFLGRELFVRSSNSFTLSEQGTHFADVVQNALSQIADAAGAITNEDSLHTLTISVPPYLAINWLIPKLGDFFERQPGISVVMDESTDLVTFQNDGIDAAIRFFDGNDDSLEVTQVMKLQMFPFASPAYLEEHGPVESFAKPAGHSLIEYFASKTVRSLHIHWEDIVEGGFNELNVEQLIFPDSLQCKYAAIHGKGIILAPLYTCEDAIEKGDLVQMGEQLFEYKNTFYFVNPKQQRVNPALYEFRDWLEEISSAYR